ncbi:class I SAM-dependent methyltransferase [Flaviaesturariibacter amylovorans]|uniref:Class I SAM-dependent methyltransferase n=1 Tax=Flaviaesturariibacter amylovorans TaxID=1084520 RepID=A0ABP8HEH4_9BACT
MKQDTATNPGGAFEPAYLALRAKEGRLYSDAELRMLPEVPSDHPYAAEWELRRLSAGRLCRWLGAQRRPLRVLEVGCGNGWLAHRLAAVPQCVVVGTDINRQELAQAQRVFVRSNLFFTDTGLDRFTPGSFDVVVFAAALHYFPDLGGALQAALALLKPGGAVHVVDTYFYGNREAVAAAARSRAYFASMGCAGMAGYYFHHRRAALAPFRPRLGNRAEMIFGLLRRGARPFPWYTITKAVAP